jgi:hypothetical protein
MMATEPRVVVVAGDMTIDWNLARLRRSFRPGSTPSKAASAHASFEPGGASLLAELVAGVAADLSKRGREEIEVRSGSLPAGQVVPGDERVHHSYALWSRFDVAGGAKAWRVQDFLGFERAPTESLGTVGGNRDTERADLVILDDAGLGFRDRPDLWPRALEASSDSTPWIVLKMAKPVAQGPLWDHLQAVADRVIVVIRIDDLRLTEVNISRELSWERTAQDLTWELIYNHRINDLARCAHVVVSFSTAGALLLSAPGGDDPGSSPRSALFFDPRVMEDMWTEEHPGSMMGYTACLTAALAGRIMVDPVAPDIDRGIQRGIAAMRSLHLQGYAERDPGAAAPRLTFPFDRIVKELGKDEAPFATAEVRDPASVPAAAYSNPDAEHPRDWTILVDRYPGGLEELARRIVLEGTEGTLRGVPIGQFGNLLTVDRHEIEGYRSIRTLIREYARQPRPERPLSIAVFGPPGSGKSFGVKEVARSVLPGRIEKESILTFNLSQFDDPSELMDALHQVRDASLTGLLPLVFWDEFDTGLQGQPLGWLRHFLSPMQDGTFQENQIVHPIGPAVFVFAGGTRARMQDFGSPPTQDFVEAKGPDFVSRLKGYVNVLGPNRRDIDPGDDPYYLVRRAILVRAMLVDSASHLFHRQAHSRDVLEIDLGVLRAFLLTREYRHGARSMESIISMSTLFGKARFERSCLPAEAQLDIHVDARDFLDLVQRLELEGGLLERLAEAAHVVFCAGRLAHGKSWGEESDDYLMKHELLQPFAGRRRNPDNTQPTLVPYERLPEEDREQNRSLVRDIPNKLAGAGFAMRPARSGDPPSEFTGEVVELLSEQEHDRWMLTKLSAGWSYGDPRDDKARLHPALLLWRRLSYEERVERYGAEWAARMGDAELPEDQKEKDRELIRSIARILALTGYTVARVGTPGP